MFLDIFIPFATAKETLIEEKLPGPLFTKTEKVLDLPIKEES